MLSNCRMERSTCLSACVSSLDAHRAGEGSCSSNIIPGRGGASILGSGFCPAGSSADSAVHYRICTPPMSPRCRATSTCSTTDSLRGRGASSILLHSCDCGVAACEYGHTARRAASEWAGRLVDEDDRPTAVAQKSTQCLKPRTSCESRSCTSLTSCLEVEDDDSTTTFRPNQQANDSRHQASKWPRRREAL